MRDDCDDDGSSVNLLTMRSHDEETDEGTVCCSPATQTLNSLGLSQSRIDLRGGGLSQADLDLAAALVSVRNDKTMRLSPPKSRRSSSWIQADDSPVYPMPSRWNNGVPQDKLLPMTSHGPSSVVEMRPHVSDKKRQDRKKSSRGRNQSSAPEILQISDKTGNFVGSFSTCSAAAQASGVSRQMVTRILNGEIDQCKGWRFEFARDQSEEDEEKEEENQHPRKANRGDRTKSPDRGTQSGTVCIEQVSTTTGKVLRTFPTYTAAGKAVNCDRRVIAKIANGTMQGFNGFTFRQSSATAKTTTAPEPIVKDTERPKRRRDPKSRSIPIQQLDAKTGRLVATHPSILVASASAKVNRHKVYAVLRGDLDSWDGKVWRYESEVVEESTKPPPTKKAKSAVSSEAKPKSKRTAIVSTARKSKRNDEAPSASGDRSDTVLFDKTRTALASKRAAYVDDGSTTLWNSPQSRQTSGDTNVTATEDASIAARSRRQESVDEGKGNHNAKGESVHLFSRRDSRSTARSGKPKMQKPASKAVSIQQFDAATGRLVATHASILEAATKAGVNRHRVYAVLKGDKSECNGIVWKYCTNHLTKHASIAPADNSVAAEVLDAATNSQHTKTSAGAIPVQEFDVATGGLIETHSSISAAGKSCGINRRKIYSILHGDASEFQGKTFRYLREKEEAEEPHDPEDSLKRPEGTAVLEIIATDDSPAVIPDGDGTILQDCGSLTVSKEKMDPIDDVDCAVMRSDDSTRKHDDSPILVDRAAEETSSAHRETPKATSVTEKSTKPDIAPSTEQDAGTKHPSAVQQFDAHGRLVASFSSISFACAKSGAKPIDVFAVLNGKVDDWNGIRWSYFRGGDVANSAVAFHDDAKLVFVEEIDSSTGRIISEYSSIPEVAEKHRIEAMTIYNVLNGHLCDWNGLFWRYAAEGDDETTMASLQPNDTAPASAQDDYTLTETGQTRPGESTNTDGQHESPAAQSHSATSSGDVPPPAPSRWLPEKGANTDPFFAEGNEYIVLEGTVQEDGPIGVNVTYGQVPIELFDTLNQDTRLYAADSIGSSMRVTSFMSSMSASPASMAGIQVDDWLFLLEDDKKTVHMAYDAVRHAVVHGKRPLTFLLGRKKSVELLALEKTSISLTTPEPQNHASESGIEGSNERTYKTLHGNHVHQPTTSKQESISEKSCSGTGQKVVDHDQPAVLHDDTSNQDNCAAAKKSTVPSNPCVPFCVKCKQQKKTGMHHPWCPKNPQFEKSGAGTILRRLRLGIKAGCTVCQTEYKTGKRAKGNHLKDCEVSSRTKSRKTKPLESELHDNDTTSIQDEEAESFVQDVDAGSVFETSKKHARMHRLRFVDPKSTSKRNHGEISGANRSNCEPHSKINVPKSLSVSSTDRAEDPVVVWKKCPNPWGKIELSLHDEVVLSSSQAKISHYPSPRYALNPFDFDKYKKTHQNPKHGCHVVVLQRDPSCLAPWGFKVKKHEFGGACIISSVDSLSPSSSGSWIGMDGTQTAPLSVHDMILSVNGHLVGGMDADCLGAILDTCQSKLVLVIARYLHTRALKDRLCGLEARQHQQIDLLLNNDEQELEWIDFERVSRTLRHHVPMIPGNASTFDGNGLQRFVPSKQSSNTMVREKSPDRDNGTSCMQQLQLSQGRTEPMVIDEQAMCPLGTTLSVTDCDDRALSPSSSLEASPGRNWSSPSPSMPEPYLSFKPFSSPVLKKSSLSPTFFDEYKDTQSVLSGHGSLQGGNCDDDDDGNAWLGCPCGVVHRSLPVFWIQCDSCNSWYNASPPCVGFDESEAIKLPSWVCAGCKGSCSPGNTSGDPDCVRSPMESSRSEAKCNDEGKEAISAAAETPKKPRFKKNDIVLVEEHGWEGVNNEGGIAHVLKAYEDEENDVVYDIKYIVGGYKKKAVLEEYLEAHSFD